MESKWNFMGEKDGRGVRINTNNVQIGYWKRDKPHGCMLTLYANGARMLQDFREGVKCADDKKYDAVGETINAKPMEATIILPTD